MSWYLPGSVYTEVSDGKGGKIKVKKAGGKAAKDAIAGKKKKQKDPNAVFSDSDCTTDSDDVDLENMTEEEKKAYFEAKAARAAAREARRREKYGDKYDEMMAKHKEYEALGWLLTNITINVRSSLESCTNEILRMLL